MLHLPALKITGEIDKVLRAAKDLRLAVRGLYGEGTDAVGDFFQLSNQVTLGVGRTDRVGALEHHVFEQVAQPGDARTLVGRAHVGYPAGRDRGLFGHGYQQELHAVVEDELLHLDLLGVRVMQGYAPENLNWGPDTVVVGNVRGAGGRYRIGHDVMNDALDQEGVYRAIRSAGLDLPERAKSEDLDGKLVNVFVKCEADPTSRLRGRRQVSLDDSDVHHHRHIKGAVGGVVGAAVDDAAVFVSVAALHQGPSGGGPVAAIVDLG